MSTILEALKKSEQERNDSAVPVLASVTAPEEKKSFWFWLLMALVALVVLVCVYWFASQMSNQQSASTSPNPAPTAEVDAVVTSSRADEGIESQLLSEGFRLADGSRLAEGSRPAEGSRLAEGSVIIAGNTYREGDFYEAGAKVEQILNNVVVLNVRGEQLIVRP